MLTEASSQGLAGCVADIASHASRIRGHFVQPGVVVDQMVERLEALQRLTMEQGRVRGQQHG
eukprot:3637537-Amphidinium_carterae.1